MDEIFFYNLLPSYNQPADLAETNVKAIGIVRENRTMVACKKMKPLKEMKKSDKGIFEFRGDCAVYFCKWNDNSVVNIGRNFLSRLPNSAMPSQK